MPALRLATMLSSHAIQLTRYFPRRIITSSAPVTFGGVSNRRVRLLHIGSAGRRRKLISPNPNPNPGPALRVGNYRSLSYFVESHIGLRRTNEDAYAILSNEDDSLSIYAVYDGHAGGRCSVYLAENLADRVYEQLSTGSVSDMDVDKILQQTFLDVDDEFCKAARMENRTDGSTALMAVVCRNPGEEGGDLWVANAGDCRAVLIRASGSTEQLSTDHKALLEKERIEEEGGFVATVNGIGRVNGALAVSRAFGNATFKPFVTARPEVMHRRISRHDSFLCLATDGLWEDVTNQEVGHVLHQAGVKVGTKLLRQMALKRGSVDNVTILSVDLRQSPQQNEEALPSE